MGVLSVHHPDILDFIRAKHEEGALRNFNISVAVTELFMDLVKRDEPHLVEDWSDPHVPEKPLVPLVKDGRNISAREVWNIITESAWRNGEPGVIFIDTVNRANPVPHLGRIEATNPCLDGDTPILTPSGSVAIAEIARQSKHGPVKVIVDSRMAGEQFLGALVASVVAWSTGVRETIRIRTESGRELILTPNHRVMTTHGWKAAGKLRPRVDKLLVHGEHGTELVVEARRRGYSVKEVPVAVDDRRPSRQPLAVKVSLKLRDLLSARLDAVALALGCVALAAGLFSLAWLSLRKVLSGSPGFANPYSYFISTLLVTSGLQVALFGLLANLILQMRRSVEPRETGGVEEKDQDN